MDKGGHVAVSDIFYQIVASYIFQLAFGYVWMANINYKTGTNNEKNVSGKVSKTCGTAKNETKFAEWINHMLKGST